MVQDQLSILDANLHARIIAGDATAFVQAVCPLEERLRSIATRYFVRGTEVDDLIQDAFCIAWEQRHKLCPEVPLYPWLRAIVKNHCLNRLRNRSRRHAHRADLARFELARQLERTEDEANQRLDALRVCLDGLAEQHRELLDQRYAQQRAVRDLAASMGTSPNGLSMRLARLRDRLRTCVEKSLEDSK